MDLALVLTHRCNLACTYCFAGEHHRTDMPDAVVERALPLLFVDRASTPRLSFFGGEPFVAFAAMRRAAEGARRLGSVRLHCSTNGTLLEDEQLQWLRHERVSVTVSIDGPSHDANRPSAGHRPTRATVERNLFRLVAAEVPVRAAMVITPTSVEETYLTVGSFWREGVERVRAQPDLTASWTRTKRAALREQLEAIATELLARRLRGESVSFDAFAQAPRGARRGVRSSEMLRLTVGTDGHLYPCTSMVGDGRGLGLRLGHLDDGPTRILARVRAEGARCDGALGCECAAYLETGDRHQLGPMGAWYAQVCRAIGETLAEIPRPTDRPPEIGRRPMLLDLVALAGAGTAFVAAQALQPTAALSKPWRPKVPAPRREPAPAPAPAPPIDDGFVSFN